MNVFLYFEDWSEFLYRLEGKDFPIGDRIIKVFGSVDDPRVGLAKKTLTVCQSEGDPFQPNERYKFSDGRIFFGWNLEAEINAKGVNETGKQIARALFRFSWQLEFVQNAMAFRTKDGNPIIDSPIAEIDGWNHAVKNPHYLHLDIFFRDSLEALSHVIDYRNSDLLGYGMTGSRWRASKK